MRNARTLPLLFLTPAFMLGLWCGRTFNLPPMALICIALSGLTGIVIAQVKRRSSISGFLFAGGSSVLLFAIAMGYCSFWFRPAPDHLSHWENREVILSAEVTAQPRKTQSGWRAEVEAMEIREGDQVHTASGKTWIYFREGHPGLLHTHDLITVPVKIRPASSRNASFLTWMLGQGITHLANGKAEEIEVTGRRKGVIPLLTQLRESIIGKMRKGMDDPNTSGFAVALMLGDRSGLESEVKADFGASGLMHVLAISGMHICLILVVLDGMIRAMSGTVRMRRTGEILALALLIIYGLMSGGSPAVMRAVISVGMLLIARMAHLRTHQMNVLAAAAFLQLVWDPAMLWDAGFQLSYAAMGGILLWSDKWAVGVKGFLPFLPTAVSSNIAMTLAAQAATLPLILYHFGQFPTYFLLANLLTMFLATWAVRIGFFSLVFCFVPYLGNVLLGMLDFILFLLIRICGFVADLPGATVREVSLRDTGFVITLGLITLCALGYFVQQRRRKISPVNAPSLTELDKG